MPWAFNDARGGEVGWAVRFCRQINTEHAELIKEYPRRVGAFAAVPAATTDQALTETVSQKTIARRT